jgi:serine-type D-Ala-D-Ala carboxypeptidase (penicillin-binding protein 5/6)
VRSHPALAAAVAALAVAATALSAPAQGASPPPTLVAPQAILFEPQTGDVILRKAADAERPVASTTKLMTALLVLERAKLDDVFTAVPYQAQEAESRINLKAGERMTVRDLLRALLLESANDAAATLAVGVSGSQSAFVAEMNDRARELGLRHTAYANPIGLDEPGNHSSAADLVKLANRLRRNAFFRRTVATRSASLTTGDHTRQIENTNDLVGDPPGINGVKTGHTLQAGYVLVGSATRGRVNVLSAVLGDPSKAARDADTLALLRYGLSLYHEVPIVRPDRVAATARVKYREEDRIELVPARRAVHILRRGERPVATVSAKEVLEGPLPRGTVAGSVTVRVRGRVVARVPLVTAQPVPHVSLAERAVDFVFKPGTLAVIFLVAAGGAALFLGLHRRRRAKTQAPSP